MPKTWAEKFARARPAHVKVLSVRFAGVPVGGRLYITSPQVVQAYMHSLAPGVFSSMGQMRATLAAQANADATCPVAAAFHARIVAELATEALGAGTPSPQVAPFWRLIDPASDLAHKLTLGSEGIQRLRDAEHAC